ncbi:two-component regulator propeller domain-containing protein [Pedobacter rhizosphaerae]|uniref:histidine kinase n=1 Tax=Pedobacter rhizosphaerae TaxID=390241 RepID=A0A1H9MMA0_9SPHI|nr:two-component regulator propeller domain-containing protein [Pedobacter rhizosphaerae]SER24834.1 Signal transduction histidine kinase [Pedobacter rhizosphaerae]
MTRSLKVIACLLLSYCFCSAQVDKQTIKYLGVEDGLSNNVVNSLYQDRFGFIWMGTYDGLNRYDGYSFKVFRNKWDNENSLINNHIIALNGDAKDRVWIGTQKGISYFDYSDTKIHPVYYLNQPQIKITSAINTISVSKNGDVYIGSEEKGLFVVKNGADKASLLTIRNNNSYSVKASDFDQNDVLWFSIKDRGIYTWTNAELKLVFNGIKGVTKLLNGANNQLWVGTENGLFILDKKTKILRRAPFKLSNENIMSLRLNKNGQLWVATDGGGITIHDIKKNHTEYLTAGKEKGSLSSNSIGAILEDRESRKWIATLRGGVDLIDSKDTQFKTINADPFQQNTLVNNFVLSFCEDAEHNIWIGTDGGGLSIWNPKTKHFQNLVHHSGNPGTLTSNFVTSILKDNQNTIWVASFSGGIDRYDKLSGKFKHYHCYNTVKGIEEVNLWKLFQDRKGNLWAGTTKGGALYRFNPLADKFDLFDNNLRDIHTIYEDRSGVLWAGNYTHLIKIDVAHKKHQFVPVNSAIRAIHEDRFHNFWIGTEGGGLLNFNRKSYQFVRYIEDNGLPSNSILNILEDNSGNLWCSTYNGLSKLNIKSKSFKNYYATDGLQSNQFNYNAALKLSNGEFLFGGIKGFNKFYPDSIRINKRVPQLVLTDFRVNNVPIDDDPYFDKASSVVNLQEISIPFNAAVISVDFAAIEYSFQDQIKYAYFLEGWDRDWNFVDKLNTAYYSRLNEGHYKLHIKSTDTEGAWSNNEKIIKITILPPWYRTWWAYSLYFIAVSSLYYLFWLYRKRQQRLKHEVEITNMKMEKEKELNEKKLNFFTNISHELRTPLTLIVNPIKDILSTKESGAEKNDLNVVYRNSRRLLSLVDQLLLFRKSESENDSLKLVELNLFKFAKEIFMCFSYLAKNNHIQYTFHCEDENLKIQADKEKLEIILFNLLSNALKFTPKEGFVRLAIVKNADRIQISVSDSGPGIPEEVGDKLFDKFYKVMNKTSLKIGFGIGLYLVKNFVELHKGTISYQTKSGEGTTFILHLPQVSTIENIQPSVGFDNELTYVNELISQEEEEERAEQERTGHLELLISDLHTILIVDDNEEVLDYIQQIFKNTFKIYRAENGLYGLKVAQEFLPDIIISDVNMDGLNGIELCKAVKEDQALSHIPVILLTADPSNEMRLMGLEAGAYDFIAKPFDKELFTAKINSVIKNRTNLQSYFYNEITLKSDTYKVSQEDKGFLQRCITIIEENLMETEFNVKSLASDLGMSHSNLYKKIKTTSGLSINSFIRFIRIRKAAELLINTNLNINEAAFRVGINDIKYFREQFQKQFKLTPSDFIKKHRKTFHKHYSVNTNL